MAMDEKLRIDIDELRKGQSIAGHVVRKCVGGGDDMDEAEFAFRRHIWVQKLQDALHDRGKLWTVRLSGEMVLVLDDQAASLYNARKFAQAIEKLERRQCLMLAVDVNGLSEGRKRDHERTLRRQSHLIGALDDARGSWRSISHCRTRGERPSLIATEVEAN